MIDPDNVPEVHGDEMLARFILNKKHFRPSDNAVKPVLFLAYKHVGLSVNRHRDYDESEIWQFGRNVAEFRNKSFHGRSDIPVSACTFDVLAVKAKPIRNHPDGLPDNPNHADIVGFPSAKEDQLSFAAKLAAAASDRMELPAESE